MITYFARRVTTSLKVTEIIRESPDTFTFKFKALDNIKWKPGSHTHFMSSNLRKGNKLNIRLMRKLSIMTHPSENEIGFTTRIRNNSSEFKKSLYNLKINDEIRCFKPVNNFKDLNFNKPIVLISMGVGIATFRPIVLEYLANSTTNSFITNINIDRVDSFIYDKEFKNFPNNIVKNCFVKNRDDLYKEIKATFSNKKNIYYIVGSTDFNKAISKYLLNNQISKNSILLDKRNS